MMIEITFEDFLDYNFPDEGEESFELYVMSNGFGDVLYRKSWSPLPLLARHSKMNWTGAITKSSKRNKRPNPALLGFVH
jgi:hypothetical protein